MARGHKGEFIFAHRMRNSNINTEAFMRTGKPPYVMKLQTKVPNGRLETDMTAVQTTVPLVDALHSQQQVEQCLLITKLLHLQVCPVTH